MKRRKTLRNGNGIVKELALLAAEAGGVKGDFGLGSPNDMPPWLAILRYIWELINPFSKKHGYGLQNGMDETRQAEADWHRATYGIGLDPNANITITEGSRSACIFALPEGGKVVLPQPYYPGHLDAIKAQGCEPLFVPLISAKNFALRVRELLRQSGHGISAVIFCLDNPVWLPCEVDVYREILRMAKEHNVLVVFDEAYRELVYHGPVTSVFDVKDILEYLPWIVITKSASKAFAGAGWKVGVVISSPERIASITKAKCLYSEGGNVPAQLAYATARRWCRRFPTKKLARVYLHRAELTVSLLHKAGLKEVFVPQGGMFLWFQVPGNSEDFVRELAKRGYTVRPGTIFGKEGRVRWCLREPDRVTRGACAAVCEVMKTADVPAPTPIRACDYL